MIGTSRHRKPISPTANSDRATSVALREHGVLATATVLWPLIGGRWP